MIQLIFALSLQAATVANVGNDYAAAYQQAADSGKPLVVLVGAEWCPGCRQMKYTAIPELQKTGGLENVAFAYVNSDQQGELAGKLMQGSSIPQLVMYQKTASGWKRQQLTGAHSTSSIREFLNQAAAAPLAKLSSQN